MRTAPEVHNGPSRASLCQLHSCFQARLSLVTPSPQRHCNKAPSRVPDSLAAIAANTMTCHALLGLPRGLRQRQIGPGDTVAVTSLGSTCPTTTWASGHAQKWCCRGVSRDSPWPGLTPHPHRATHPCPPHVRIAQQGYSVDGQPPSMLLYGCFPTLLPATGAAVLSRPADGVTFGF
jgi:hypothetical protein